MMKYLHRVILSNAKDLDTSTNAPQILHYVQNDTERKFRLNDTIKRKRNS